MSANRSLTQVLAAGMAPRVRAQVASAVPQRGTGGWFPVIHESFGGAFQQNITVDAARDVLAFSAVFACVTVIASDIAKLRIKLCYEDEDGIGEELRYSPLAAVLKKPNSFQNRVKFIEQWIVSKLLHGNTYVLKRRDARGVVIAGYILDPQRVIPLVTEGGDVYYRLSSDNLSGLRDTFTVPASEIIHDTMVCLFHPLVGISPIYACGMSATMGNRIQANSTIFFNNMSRPSGMLTAPGTIDDQTAARLKTHWEENFAGQNIGRIAVLGSNLKYEAMTIPAQEAQLIEQLRWTVEDVARCFHMPLFKIGGPVPVNNTTEVLQQTYYSDCLQSLIESLEVSLDFGLALPNGYYTECDLDGLLRMDQAGQVKMLADSVKGSIRSPNEARAKLNLKPVKGGKSPMAQHQDYSLEALAKRDAKPDPFATTALPAPKREASNDDETPEGALAALADLFVAGLHAP